MRKPNWNWRGLFTAKRLAPVVAIALVVAIIFGTMYFLPGQNPESPFAGFSKLIINPAYAADNFDLVPSDLDSLGVEANSYYVLTSKEAVETKLIEDNLKVEGDVGYELKKISDTEWQIIPKEALEPGTLFKVSLAASYLDKNGEQKERDFAWAYQVKDNFKVLNAIPGNHSTNVPLDAGIEVTFSHDNFVSFDRYFTISPEVHGRFEKHGRTMVFVPYDNLSAGTIYTVVLKKGLPLADSTETLADDYSYTFETTGAEISSNRNVWFRAYKKIYEVGVSDQPLVQLSVSGMEKGSQISANVYSFSSSQKYIESLQKRDELPWWSYSKDEYREDVSKLKKVDNYDLGIDSENNINYLLFPSALPTGFYLVEFEAAGVKDQIWLQVTDLSAYIKITETDSLAWVNDLSTKDTVGGALVELIGSNYTARTNSKGVATLNFSNDFLRELNNTNENNRYYLRISSAGKELIMPAAPLSRGYFGSSIYGGNLGSDDYWSYLYTDRPRYQTTDTVKFWGLAKNRDAGTSKPKEAKITLYKTGYVDYYYRPVTIVEQTVTVSEDGVFSGEINFENLKADYYNLKFEVDGNTLETKYLDIRPYVKPAYELTLTPDRAVAFAGETINLEGQATFFEGTPVANLKLVYQTPDGKKTVTTDDKGKVNLAYKQDYNECRGDYNCWPNYVYLSLSPEDSELAEIVGETNLRFYGPNVYFQDEVKYPEAGVAEIDMTTKKIDINKLSGDDYWSDGGLGDKPAGGTKIEGEVIKIIYEKRELGTSYDFVNKRSYKTYSYSTKEETVDNFTVYADENGKYTYRLKIDPSTSYQVKTKVYDTQGRSNKHTSYLYYYDGRGINHYSSSGYDYYHLELAEGETYSVGEEVNVSFKNNDELMPDGERDYLYLQLHAGLQEYQVADSSLYKFNFEERDIPNINLAAVYFTGESYVLAKIGYWGQQVRYDTSDKTLKIDISTNKKSYKPGDDAEIEVRVTDKDGRPVEANVNLNLIDEAFYAVANDVASPIETIYKSISDGSIYEAVSHTSVTDNFGGAEKGGCFTAGTMIEMADGSSKPIEKVEPGDKISTFASPQNLERVSGEVTEVYQHMVSEYLIINGTLEVTPQHLVYANYQFKPAGMLKQGDWLLNTAGEKIFVTKIENVREIVPVYNFRVDPQHTYIAGGFYVHNEKGGGPREFFTDAALFENVKTNSSGIGRVTFTLPDNITSWRVTAQGIGDDLSVGLGLGKIPVSLPVFADVTIDSLYLLGDRPEVRLRAFGDSLNSNDKVNFTIKAPSLNLDKSETLSTTAFASAYFQLPEFSLGEHKIIYQLESSKGNDSLQLPIKVITSRLEYLKADDYDLFPGFKVKPDNNDLPVIIVLSDQGQGKLYQDVSRYAWLWGDRVDQKVARYEARKLLNKYYEEDVSLPEVDGSYYQLSGGGIALLPYGDPDLELSARLASISPDIFDGEALRQYFFGVLENRSSNHEEISLALFGLAELNEPMIPRIQSWLKNADDDLTPIEKLYLAQGIYDLGAKEWSLSIYYDVVNAYAQIKEPEIIIKVSDKPEEVVKATALAAKLAAALQLDEADGLWHALVDEPYWESLQTPKEALVYLEKVGYLAYTVDNLKPSPVKVTYKLFGEEKEVSLNGGRSKSFQIYPSQLDQLEFTGVEGQVGISVRQIEPLATSGIKTDKDISVSRAYYVNGKPANTFNQDDLIEVRLYPTFSADAIDGSYQLTDFLPSGLVPVTKLYIGDNYNSGRCSYWYPYNNDGKSVKYRLTKDWNYNSCNSTYIKYYARVKTPGKYTAEPAVIQSFYNPDYINFSSYQEILIKE